MKVRIEMGLWSLTVGLGWRYRFGFARKGTSGGSAGFGIGWARWLKRLPTTGRRLSVRVIHG